MKAWYKCSVSLRYPRIRAPSNERKVYKVSMHLSSRKFILPYPFLLREIMGFSFLLNARLNHRVRRNNKLVNTSHHYSYTSLPRLQPQPEKKIIKNKKIKSKLCRGEICVANFIPPVNGASLGSNLVKNSFLSKRGK